MAPSTSLDTDVRIPPEVLFRDLGGEGVLLHLATGRYYGLDEVGTRTWDLLMATGRLAEVFRTLAAEYDVSADRLRQDLLAFVDQLCDRGLVEFRET